MHCSDKICIYLYLSAVVGLRKLAGHNWPTDCFIRIFECSIRVSRSFTISVAGHSKYWEGLGPARPALGYATAIPNIHNT